MKWTEQDIIKTRQFLTDNLSNKEIAIKLNRTTDSVRNKLQKLELSRDKKIKEFRCCIECKKNFETLIASTKKFCGLSCSASFNNRLKAKKIECLNCKTQIPSYKKYCTKLCGKQHKKNQLEIELNNKKINISEYRCKIFLIDKFGEQCMNCGWKEVNITSGKIPIQLEHIDGNSDNNELTNLKLLCPNCHSLTSTYGTLNKGNGRDTKRNIKRRETRKRLGYTN